MRSPWALASVALPKRAETPSIGVGLAKERPSIRGHDL